MNEIKNTITKEKNYTIRWKLTVPGVIICQADGPASKPMLQMDTLSSDLILPLTDALNVMWTSYSLDSTNNIHGDNI